MTVLLGAALVASLFWNAVQWRARKPRPAPKKPGLPCPHEHCTNLLPVVGLVQAFDSSRYQPEQCSVCAGWVKFVKPDSYDRFSAHYVRITEPDEARMAKERARAEQLHTLEEQVRVDEVVRKTGLPRPLAEVLARKGEKP